MIHEIFQRAGQFHGHTCPGLAIGVRAAVEAIRLLEIKNTRSLYCIAENRACYVDGIQAVLECTLGNGRLEIRPRGKAAFNFYDRENGKSLRLIAGDRPAGLSREESVEYILTAPLEEVFSVTPVHFQAPPDNFSRRKSARCARCGEECDEPFLRIEDGEIVCLDCAEQVLSKSRQDTAI